MLAISLVVIGVLTGAGQWAVLRMRLKRVWMWIPATAIGVPLGFFVGLAVDTGIFAAGDTLNISGLLGLVVGVPQWLVIRKKVEKAYWWLPASILSWAFGAKIGFDFLGQINLEHLSWAENIKLSGVIMGLSFGSLVGIIGGLVMAQLLKNPFESGDEQLDGQ
jgi:hypothetical protein